MDRSKIEHLLKEDEGYKLDFKLRIALELESEKKEFVKDTIAIANSAGGRGYILFGIEDRTKKIIGIDALPDDIEERIQQIITYRSVPPIPVSFECVEFDEKVIGVLTIFTSRQRPHQMAYNGAFYIRRGSTTDKATRYEIASMLQSGGLLSFERVPCRQATLEDLELSMMEQYFERDKDKVAFNLQLLVALGIIEEDERSKAYYPTYGGLLLMGKSPQTYIPHTCIEVSYQDKEWMITGNILKMLGEFRAFIRTVLPKDYPIEALEEVVGNAIMHRDYWNTFYYTHVRITDEKIYVENPSDYPFKVTGYRHVRNNAWLYSRLLLLKQSRQPMRIGIGIHQVKKIFADRGEVTIENDRASGLFRVCLPGIVQIKELTINS